MRILGVCGDQQAIGASAPSPKPVGQTEDAAAKLSPYWIHWSEEVICNDKYWN